MAVFSEMFKVATGYCPYPYQTKFTTLQELPAMLLVPTGCGKRAAIVLGWLRRRPMEKVILTKDSDFGRIQRALPLELMVSQWKPFNSWRSF